MPEKQYQRYSDRFFEVSPLLTRPGWYARLREGGVVGPFPSREAAHIALCELFGLPTEVCEALERQLPYAPDGREA